MIHCNTYNEGRNLPPKPELIPGEHWWFPDEVFGVNATFSLGFRLFVSFQDRVGETDDVLAFVVLKQLKRRASGGNAGNQLSLSATPLSRAQRTCS